LGLLHRYMINLATHIVLLASLVRSLWSARLWRRLSKPVTIIPLRGLHSSLRTVVSIVSQLSTLETPIELNRGSVSDRCPEPLLEQFCWGVGVCGVWGLKRCGWNEHCSCKFYGYFPPCPPGRYWDELCCEL
jgi:hypothetical protein